MPPSVSQRPGSPVAQAREGVAGEIGVGAAGIIRGAETKTETRAASLAAPDAGSAPARKVSVQRQLQPCQHQRRQQQRRGQGASKDAAQLGSRRLRPETSSTSVIGSANGALSTGKTEDGDGGSAPPNSGQSTSADDNIGGSSLANAGMTGGMYGGGYGGYGGLGMMSPYGMGMYGMGGYGMMPMGGPLSGLNNLLFGFQSVVFSLGQAMQILGMNTQALHQLFNTAMSMLDNALAVLNEMRALDVGGSRPDEELSEDELKRRRRLRAIRWSLTLGVSYVGYRMVHRWLARRRQLRSGGGHGGAPAGYLGSAGGHGAMARGYGTSFPSAYGGGYGRRQDWGRSGWREHGGSISMDGYGGGYGYGTSSQYGGMGEHYGAYGGNYGGY